MGQTCFHGVNSAARQCPHDEFAHASVPRCIVEHQAVGVMFVKGRVLSK